MIDFIAEVRPETYSKMDMLSGFVAEVREPLEYRHSSPHTHISSACQYNLEEHSEAKVKNLLSQNTFSKEGMTQLMTNSIVSLIEKLLTGRVITSIDADIRVGIQGEAPIRILMNERLHNQIGAQHICPHEASPVEDLHIALKKQRHPSPTLSSCSPSENILPYERTDLHEQCLLESRLFQMPESSMRHCEVTSPEAPEECVVTTTINVEEVQSPVEIRSPKGPRNSESDEEVESGYCGSERGEQTDGFISERRLSPSPQSKSVIRDRFGNVLTKAPRAGDELDDTDIRTSSTSEDDEEELPLVIDVEKVDPVDETETCHIIDTQNIPSYIATAGDCVAPTQLDTATTTENLNYPSHHGEESKLPEIETERINVQSSETVVRPSAPMDLSGDCKIPAQTKAHAVLLDKSDTTPTDVDQNSPVTQSSAADSHMCTICKKSFTAKNNLNRHLRIHTGDRPYKCNQCDMSFARRDDLKGHSLRHDYNKPFRCSICKKGYTDRACVKNHMSKEHGSRLMHVCPQCGESFETNDKFTAHKKSHPELDQFACSTCPFIGTNHLMALKHNLLHTHKLFSCKPCNAYFADPFDYTYHIRKHKKIHSFIRYVCCFCNTVLPTYEQFVRHEYSHAQGKTYGCRVCNKQFKSKSSMQDHEQTHMESKKASSDSWDISQAAVTDNIPLTFEPHVLEKQDANLSTTRRDKIRVSELCQSRESGCDKDNIFVEQPVKTLEKLPSETFDTGIQMDNTPLDLSIGKTATRGTGTHQETVKSGVDETRADITLHSCQRQEDLSLFSVPRNGYAARPLHSQQECLGVQQRIEETNGKNSTCLDRQGVKTNTTSVDALAKNSDLVWTSKKQQLSPVFQLQTKLSPSFGGIVKDEPKHDLQLPSRTLHRSDSSSSHSSTESHRFIPYPKAKLQDIASKYLAKQGNVLLPQSRLSSQNDVDSVKVSLSKPLEKQDVKEINAIVQHAQHILPRKKLYEKLVAGKRKNGATVDVSPQFISDLGKENFGIIPAGTMLGLSGKPCPTSPDMKSTINEKAEDSPRQQDPALSPSSKTIGNHDLPHNCDICKDDFDSFAELETHSLNVHKRYLCEHCRKGFTARPNRDRHVRYHTGERPYKCDLCDMAFFRGDDLKYHRTTRHPTADPFVCTRCSATFTWAKDLERHIRHSLCEV